MSRLTYVRRGGLSAALLALVAALSMLLSGPAATAAAPAPNSDGAGATSRLGVEAAAAPTYESSLSFDSAYDTHTFTVRIAPGGNRFTAETLDCCVAGDHWGVFVMRYGGTPTGVSNPNASNCGTGSTTRFSGPATLSGTYLSGKTVQVIVTHCSGVSSFPAGLSVRFRSNVAITVTQRS